MNNKDFSLEAVIYARVSSKEQEQGYSLEAQRKLAEEYAQRNDFKVVKIYQVSESASGKKQRQVFLEMLTHAKKNDIRNVLVEKTDRLTRNPKEAVMVQDWLDLDDANQVHCMKENLILHKNSRAHEKLMWDVKVSIARFYVNNLSEEVRKGLNEKASEGFYPGSSKVGYISAGEKGKKSFKKDPETHLLVKNLLEMYATGNYSMKALVVYAKEVGLRSKFGKQLYKNQIESMLKDPFYYGSFDWKGKVVAGKHEPLISKETYDRIQEVRTRRKAPHYKQHKFLFTKMMTCVECGGTITCEVQKGHIYCHCSGYNDCKQKKYALQEKVEGQLVKVLHAFEKMTPEEAEAVRERIRAKHKVEADYKMSVIDTLTGQYKGVQMKIDRLYDDRLAGIITPDFWATKNQQLLEEQKSFQEQLEKMKNQETEYFELYIDILKLAQNARAIYENKRRTDEEKRLLLKHIFGQIILGNGEVTYTLKTPVQKYSERLNSLENIFEPEKGLSHNIKTSSDARIASMLPRQGSNLRPID